MPQRDALTASERSHVIHEVLVLGHTTRSVARTYHVTIRTIENVLLRFRQSWERGSVPMADPIYLE
jgi:transposase